MSAQDYAKEIAERVIEQLQQGTAPWVRPWEPGERRAPYNPTTNKPYRGMNSLWLEMQGCGDPRWMTYKQASADGAQVIKGSKGTRIEYWKFHDERQKRDENGNLIRDANGQPEIVRVELDRPRRFTAVVFNAEQIEGLEPLPKPTVRPEPERHERAETILSNSGAKIRHVNGDRAFYSPGTDSITLPERHQFRSVDAYYSTALHEVGHWTGHPTRLARDLSHPFGSEGYAKEELRAEIGSMMIGEQLEIGHDPGQHVAYIGSWIKALQEDPREIFRAAADAEKISRYVTGLEHSLQQQAEQGLGLELGSRTPGPDKRRIAIYGGDDARLVALIGEDNSSATRAMAERIAQDPEFRKVVAKHVPDAGETIGVGDFNYGLGGMVVPDQELTLTQEGVQVAAFFPSDHAMVSELSDSKRFAALVYADPAKPTEKAPKRGEPRQHNQAEGNAMTNESLTTERTYLAVPYAEKNDAKKLGARWDRAAKSWYAPEGMQLQASGLSRWLTDTAKPSAAPQSQPPEVLFADELRRQGLVLEGSPIMDGQLRRVPVEGDKGAERSGAYVGHLDGHLPAGYIQNFKSGEAINWRCPADGIAPLSEQEKAEAQAVAAAARQRRETEKTATQEQARAASLSLWHEAETATDTNNYCTLKGIHEAGAKGLRTVPEGVSSSARGVGVRIAANASEAQAMRKAEPGAYVFQKGDLLVPLYNEQGDIEGVQTINPRFKGFQRGARKAGLHSVAGGAVADFHTAMERDPKMPIVIGEGYATGDTLAAALGHPVIVGLDSGNLDVVARQMRETYPDRSLVIAADNDPKIVNGKPRNIGVEKAKAAAAANGGGTIVPDFTDSTKGSDWNDFAAEHGIDKAQQVIKERIEQAKAEVVIAAAKMRHFAHERIADAVDNPATSVDNNYVALERDRAQSEINAATGREDNVRSGLVNVTASRNRTSRHVDMSGTARQQQTIRDEIKEQRINVLDGTSNSTEQDSGVKRAYDRVLSFTKTKARGR